jgi:NAD(P)-dependent dehydrogenase (short-subunit alcohol dehydrogenase family)
MSYRLSWHDEDHTILRADVFDTASWEENHTMINELVDRVAKAPNRVDVIINNSAGLPSGNPMPHLKTMGTKFRRLSNLGKVVIVVNNRSVLSFIQSFVGIVARSNFAERNSNRFVKSMDEAVEVIMKARARQEVPR